jgi:para-nitrobenzyl esterase
MPAIAAVPLTRLLEAQGELGLEVALRPDAARWGEIAANGMIFEPVVDGEVVPARPIERIVAGTSAGLELMVGTTSEEWRFFLVPPGAIDHVAEDRLSTMGRVMGLDVARALPLYRASRPQATPGDLLSALITDWFFRIPAVRLAEAHARNGGSGYMYEFAWRSPLFDGRFGAAHAMEIGFVFDNLRRNGGFRLAGDEPPQLLADVMHRASASPAAGRPDGRATTPANGQSCASTGPERWSCRIRPARSASSGTAFADRRIIGKPHETLNRSENPRGHPGCIRRLRHSPNSPGRP